MTPFSDKTLESLGLMPTSRILLKRLAAGMLLINFFVIALAGLSAYQSRLQYEERAEISTQNLAHMLDESIDGDVNKIDIALLTVQDEVKRQLAGGSIDSATLNALMAQQQGYQPEIMSLRATDALGTVRYGLDVSPRGGPNNSDREYFIRARDQSTPELIITKPVFARIDNKWAIVLARRLSRPDGSFAGVVYANIALEYLSKAFSKLNIGPHASVTLRDKDLAVVVRHPAPQDLSSVIGSKPSLALQSLVQTGQTEGKFHAHAPLDDIERTLSYRKISDHPLYIIVGAAGEDYLAVWWQETAQMAALALLFLLVTLLSSWLIYRFWMRQLATTKSMRDQKNFLNAILESEPECVKVIAPNGDLIQMNRAGLAMLEVDSIIEANKRGLLSFIHPEYRDAFMSLAQRIFSGESGALEFQIEGAKGAQRWLDTHATPLRNAAGEVISLVAVTHDVTERRQAQEGLQIAKEQAESALRAESEFLANMSHEIRTPMNSVLGMAYLALDIATTPKMRDYLEKILLSGKHLQGIIDDILDFSQIKEGKLNIEKIGFHLDEIRQKLINLIGEKAVKKNLKLIFDFDSAASCKLCGDPLRLSQILLNYLNNAIKFTEQGEIVVHATMLEKGRDFLHLRFDVRDTGIGMTAEEKGRLFQPFQQADGSITRKYGGSGLGLAISKRLAELMGGEVGVESEAGRGSTFWFTVRLGLAKDDQPKALPEVVHEADVAAALNGASVLLVEDDPFNQEVATAFLLRVGVDVSIAHNGKEALDLLRRQHFDCVLTDIQMPVMGGLEAIRLIRNDPALAGLRVIAMTANASNRDREHFLAAGMDDFIGKPFKPPVLYATLAKWLPARPPQIPPSSAPAKPYAEAASADDRKIIDFAEIAQFVGDDPKEIREFALRFIASAWTDIATIDAVLERKDIAAMGAIAHRMTTPALMVGATGFAELCKGLKSGRNDGGVKQARETASQLRSLLKRMEEQVRNA